MASNQNATALRHAMRDPFRLGPWALAAMLPISLITGATFFPDTFGPIVFGDYLSRTAAWVVGSLVGGLLILDRLSVLPNGWRSRQRIGRGAVSLIVLCIIWDIAWGALDLLLEGVLGEDWDTENFGAVLELALDAPWICVGLICLLVALRRDAIVSPVLGAKLFADRRRAMTTAVALAVMLQAVDPLWTTWMFDERLSGLSDAFYWSFVGATELLWYYLYFVLVAFIVRTYLPDTSVAEIAETFD
jgi:hypothetical protein